MKTYQVIQVIMFVFKKYSTCVQVLVNCVFKLPLPEFCSPEVNKIMSFYCSK